MVACEGVITESSRRSAEEDSMSDQVASLRVNKEGFEDKAQFYRPFLIRKPTMGLNGPIESAGGLGRNGMVDPKGKRHVEESSEDSNSSGSSGPHRRRRRCETLSLNSGSCSKWGESEESNTAVSLDSVQCSQVRRSTKPKSFKLAKLYKSVIWRAMGHFKKHRRKGLGVKSRRLKGKKGFINGSEWTSCPNGGCAGLLARKRQSRLLKREIGALK